MCAGSRVRRAPSKLHHLLNATSTSLSVTLAYKREPADKKAMNEILIESGFHFRFKEPGVSSKDTKPAGPDARRLLTDGKTLIALLDVCWPPGERGEGADEACGDLAQRQAEAAAAEAATVAPRHRDLVPDEAEAAYAGGLAGNVSASIFDEPDDEPAEPESESVSEPETEPEHAPADSSADDEDEDEDFMPGAADDDEDADAFDDDIDDADALDEVDEVECVGGFFTAVSVWSTLAYSLTKYCVRFDDSVMAERSTHGENTQNACRRWAEAVRAHHPTVMHFYMHQGGAHTKLAYEEGGEPDQVCDTVLELGNNRAGRIKRRICWMTKASVKSGTKWKMKRWLKPTRAARAAVQNKFERREIEREANQTLTA